MTATLESYLNRMVSIITADGRNFVGTLKGFDQTVNLILDDTHERVFSSTNGVEQVSSIYVTKINYCHKKVPIRNIKFLKIVHCVYNRLCWVCILFEETILP